MTPFRYTRASTIDGAIRAHESEESASSRKIDARYICGGTNLIDLMKMGVERPADSY